MSASLWYCQALLHCRDVPLSCFQSPLRDFELPCSLAMRINVALNISVHTLVWTYIFIAPGEIHIYYYRLESVIMSTVVRRYSNSVFGPLRKCQNTFQSNSPILHSQQLTSYARVSHFPHMCGSVPICPFTSALAAGVRLSPWLLSTSPSDTSKNEHHFMCGLLISFWRCAYPSPLPPKVTWYFLSLLRSHGCNPLSRQQQCS